MVENKKRLKVTRDQKCLASSLMAVENGNYSMRMIEDYRKGSNGNQDENKMNN